MIKISIKKREIIIKGHADFDNYGKDIVCASVSSIVTTSVNAILCLEQNTIKYSVTDGLVKIEILNDSDNTKKLLNNMINLLIELSKDYPKNIKVERE